MKPTPTPTSAPPLPPQPSLRRQRLFKAIALLLPLLLLALVEGGLRLAGYGHDLRLFVADAGHPGYWVASPYASRRYFTQAANAPVGNFEPFRQRKLPGTLRVFVLGESTTIGYPYMHNGSFHRWLQYRLLRTLPGQPVEIINLALTAVNSYTVRGFAEEVVDYEPDAVLVYAGHNEYYGALGVGSTSQLGRHPALVRWWLKCRGLRLVQALDDALAAAKTWRGTTTTPRQTLMRRMAADQHIAYGSAVYAQGVAQFADNMNGLCELLGRHRVPVFISTLVSNEKDLPPFISASGPAAESAQAQFRRGTASYAQGNFALARQQFARARELDLLRFRAPEAMNQVIRGLPGRYPGAVVVDAEGLFRQHSPHGILGRELLLEHVHPNLHGYALLSEAFYQALKQHGLLPAAPPAEMTLAQLRRQMPITAVDSLKGAYEVQQLQANWPFGGTLPAGWGQGGSAEDQLALALLANQLPWNAAMEQLMTHYLQAQNAPQALRVAEAVLLEYPYDPTFYQYASRFRAQMGQYEPAALYLEKAFQLRPSAALAQALLVLRLRLDQPARALPWAAYAASHVPDGTRLRNLQALLGHIVQQQQQLRADSTNPQLLNDLAAAYRRMGNLAVADRYGRRAARRP